MLITLVLLLLTIFRSLVFTALDDYSKDCNVRRIDT